MKFKKSMIIKSKDKETTVSITPHSIKIKYQDGSIRAINMDGCSGMFLGMDENGSAKLSINGYSYDGDYDPNDLTKLMNNIK